MECYNEQKIEGNYYETWGGDSQSARCSANGNENGGVFRSTLKVYNASDEGNNFVSIDAVEEGKYGWEEDVKYLSFQISEGQALDLVSKVLDVLVNPEYENNSTVDRKQVEDIANAVRNVRRVRTV